ncbi:protein AIG1 [Biomphalaria pfeifferi]|uniref:Protein AIG1 n=1 Tax=Biomphalaria pfeifferi TaxID=112525 RepID=A0AAD8B8M5_BIOPF|nr:protein AIG1 [Biomphalaria pfeifferi]
MPKTDYYANKKIILLVGREGNGKRSVVKSLKSISDEYNDIEAISTQGVGDCKGDRQENILAVINRVQATIQNTAEGFDAIVLVLKYGVRFTKQEKDAVEMVKLMFGDHVFRSHVAIIMTYGDLFETDSDEDGTSFESWCREQTGDIQRLFDEVNHRIVLMDNKSREKQITQARNIQRCVQLIGKKYTTEDFRNAEEGQRILIARENAENKTEPKDRTVFNGDINGNVVLSFLTMWICLMLFIISYSTILGLVWLALLLLGILFVNLQVRKGLMVIGRPNKYVAGISVIVCILYVIKTTTKSMYNLEAT